METPDRLDEMVRLSFKNGLLLASFRHCNENDKNVVAHKSSNSAFISHILERQECLGYLTFYGSCER